MVGVFVVASPSHVARVIAPVAHPLRYGDWLWGASLAWSGGYLLLCGSDLPVWLSPRADGNEG